MRQSGFIGYQAAERRRTDDAAAVNMQTLDGVAKAFLRLVGLQIEDLFGIAGCAPVAGNDLVFRAGCVRDVV